MPKFKRDDKIRLRSNAQQLALDHGDRWHPCWRDAMGSVGQILNKNPVYGWNTLFPTCNTNFWIYEDMIMLDDEEENPAAGIHKLLDRLIKDA